MYAYHCQVAFSSMILFSHLHWKLLCKKKSCSSVVSIANGYGLDHQAIRVWFLARPRVFTSPYHPERLCGPPSLLSNGYRELFHRAVKQKGFEADPSPPTSAKFKKIWTYTSTPPYVFMEKCLVKHRDRFTFFYYIIINHLLVLFNYLMWVKFYSSSKPFPFLVGALIFNVLALRPFPGEKASLLVVNL
jgi:hypothetical protein